MKRNILEGKLPLPVGNSDWADFSQKCYTVDKTLFIKELVDRGTKVALFTRPRRFGKTTAMEMLKTFFEKTAEDHSHLFKETNIWAAGEKYRALQGRYPVIYLTFKDHKALTWESAIGKLIRDVGDEVGRHSDAVYSNWSTEEKQDRLLRIKKCNGTVDETSEALGLLAEALHSYHGVKPIILIDEYDMPITSASSNGYYEQMVNFMRGFFSGAMKDNKHCEIGIMTGVMQVAKEGILSGLNNPSVWTVFDAPFSEYFGFTKDEVSEMAAYYEVPDKTPEIKRWYDGYDFGGTGIYNPWSVLRYFDNNCVPGIYWLKTSSNDLITQLIQKYPHDLKKTFTTLLKGETAYVRVSQELGAYADVLNKKETLYSLLISSGYLKLAPEPEPEVSEDGVIEEAVDATRLRGVLIPNLELRQIFADEIESKINAALEVGSEDIALAFLKNDPAALQKALSDFLRESVSYFDTASEGFYHGMTLGFLAILRNRFTVESNAESGNGRFDIALTPRTAKYPGFVIEVKAADNEADDLDALAKEALAQITLKDYVAKTEAAMKALQSQQPVVKIGLAYFKKKVSLAQC